MLTPMMERILPRVQKPARYVGGEYNQIVKEDAEVQVAFCFPDTYEIGMSNIGMRILYGVMNNMEGVWCERMHAPAPDMERLCALGGHGSGTARPEYPPLGFGEPPAGEGF